MNRRTPTEVAPALTPREMEVLVCYAEGMVGWEIAEFINREERTVQRFSGRLKLKLGVDTLPQAVARAYDLGILGVKHDCCRS